MDQNRFSYIAVHGFVYGTRCRGRPRERWHDTIKMDSEVRGMMFVEAQQTANIMKSLYLFQSSCLWFITNTRPIVTDIGRGTSWLALAIAILGMLYVLMPLIHTTDRPNFLTLSRTIGQAIIVLCVVYSSATKIKLPGPSAKLQQTSTFASNLLFTI